MTIEEIANKLNFNAIKESHLFSKIQEIRYNYGLSPRTWKPFASFSIKDDYAFHAGGRKEFQFNIGNDELEGESIFRYGLAFSLNEDRTLHNSKAEFKSKIERFNKFFISNSEFFRGFKMWYYSNNHFVEYFEEVQVISDKMFQADNFIFIGKLFAKKVEEITVNDLDIILMTFDYMLPLYELVQFGQKVNEKRIARLCWNDKSWVLPSGKYGKSEHEGSHEAKHGYGHEEWLFDTGKLIEGYHYGFLEPIRKQQDSYSGNVYDVWLYTIDGKTKKRYWVGEIKNVEVLGKIEADKVKDHYVEKHWLAEMEEQIKVSGANPEGFSNWKGVDLFNIRFIPTNARLNDPYFEIPNDNPVIGQTRYSFTFYKDEFNIINDNVGFKFTSSTDNEEDDDNTKPKTKTHIREPKAVEIVYLHKAISLSLTKELRKKYGNSNVTPEHPAGYGANRIDIVVRDKSDLIFYEIKTYPTLKTSIREAIGQLIEYSSWTNHAKAKKLVIITQPHEDFDNAKVYFKHLRSTYNLPIYYQSYDIENNILSDIV